jgi:YggT family protein
MIVLANVIQGLLYLFIIVLFIRVIFSWISPYPTNPVYRFTYQVTEPVLGPVRRVLPPMSGVDLSPLVVTLVVYFVIGLVARILVP